MNKKIIYPDHAEGQRRMREIRRADVRRALETGLRTKADTMPGKQQRWQVFAPVGNRTLWVVFIEDAEQIEIVTVQWEIPRKRRGGR
jgi:hypothetical protein